MYLFYIVIFIGIVVSLGSVLTATLDTQQSTEGLLKSRVAMVQAASALSAAAEDIDGDKILEAPAYRGALLEEDLLNDGQSYLIQSSLHSAGTPLKDGYGNSLVYCVYNHGPDNSFNFTVVDPEAIEPDYSISFKPGLQTDFYEEIAFVVLSAGANKTLETTCAGFVSNLSPLGDDLAISKTVLQLMSGLTNTATFTGAQSPYAYNVPTDATAGLETGEIIPTHVLNPGFSGVYKNAGASNHPLASVGQTSLGIGQGKGLLFTAIDPLDSSYSIYGVGSNQYGQLGLGIVPATSTPTVSFDLGSLIADEPRVFSSSNSVGAFSQGSDVFVSSSWGTDELTSGEPKAKFSSFLGLGNRDSALSTTGLGPRTFVQYGEPGTINSVGRFSFEGLLEPISGLMFGLQQGTNNQVDGPMPNAFALADSGQLWSVRGGSQNYSDLALGPELYAGANEGSVFSPHLDAFFLNSLTGTGTRSFFPASASTGSALRFSQVSNSYDTVFGTNPLTSAQGSRVAISSPDERSLTWLGGNATSISLEIPGGVRNFEICPVIYRGELRLVGGTVGGLNPIPFADYGLNTSGPLASQDVQGVFPVSPTPITNGAPIPLKSSSGVTWVINKAGEVYYQPASDPTIDINNPEAWKMAGARNMHYLACGSDPYYEGTGLYLVDENGVLYAFGYTVFGTFTKPISVSPPRGFGEVRAIVSAPGNLWVTMEDGSLWGIGANENGQLGRPASEPYEYWVHIFGPSVPLCTANPDDPSCPGANP